MAILSGMKSVVSLQWFDKRTTNTNGIMRNTTGYVTHSSDTRQFAVVSTYHQLKAVFPNETDNVPREHIGVNVMFYDRKTSHNGNVALVDTEKDLMLIMVSVDADVVESHLVCDIQPVVLSKDPPYQGQKLYSLHYPIAHGAHTAHYTRGFIANVNFQSTGKVHYYLPMITAESAGAPIFDKSSRLVVGMVQTSIGGTSPASQVCVQRQVTVPSTVIRAFLDGVGIAA